MERIQWIVNRQLSFDKDAQYQFRKIDTSTIVTERLIREIAGLGINYVVSEPNIPTFQCSIIPVVNEAN